MYLRWCKTDLAKRFNQHKRARRDSLRAACSNEDGGVGVQQFSVVHVPRSITSRSHLDSPYLDPDTGCSRGTARIWTTALLSQRSLRGRRATRGQHDRVVTLVRVTVNSLN